MLLFRTVKIKSEEGYDKNLVSSHEVTHDDALKKLYAQVWERNCEEAEDAWFLPYTWTVTQDNAIYCHLVCSVLLDCWALPIQWAGLLTQYYHWDHLHFCILCWTLLSQLFLGRYFAIVAKLKDNLDLRVRFLILKSSSCTFHISPFTFPSSHFIFHISYFTIQISHFIFHI